MYRHAFALTTQYLCHKFGCNLKVMSDWLGRWNDLVPLSPVPVYLRFIKTKSRD